MLSDARRDELRQAIIAFSEAVVEDESLRLLHRILDLVSRWLDAARSEALAGLDLADVRHCAERAREYGQQVVTRDLPAEHILVALGGRTSGDTGKTEVWRIKERREGHTKLYGRPLNEDGGIELSVERSESTMPHCATLGSAVEPVAEMITDTRVAEESKLGE